MEPWTFHESVTVLARIHREYGRTLLDSLPRPQSNERLTLRLSEGYRHITALTLAAVHAQRASQASTLDADARAAAWRRAHSLQAVWSVLHRYLVALQLREFEGDEGVQAAGREAAVLLAERCVESLTEHLEP